MEAGVKTMKSNIRFARLTFLIAGLWGAMVIVPGFQEKGEQVIAQAH